jgi:hypothetical protein
VRVLNNGADDLKVVVMKKSFLDELKDVIQISSCWLLLSDDRKIDQLDNLSKARRHIDVRASFSRGTYSIALSGM